ncbi:MAG: hypothetical protein MUO82_08190 [Candidatus Thermoplasmatota archaeon]|nr:hypothetical protein [Candidatus Thermoplasmatota archaeon]
MMANQIILTSELGCSSFELRKMSKGYNWSIKIYNTDINQAYEMAKIVDQRALADFKSADDDKGDIP